MNHSQQTAATSPHSHNIVLAGPGSGKTKTQIERAIWLVSQGHKPEDMAFVTFTSNAATVLRKRLEGVIGKPGFVGTLHAMLFRLLKADNSRWVVVSEEDASEFLEREIKLFNYRGSRDELDRIRQLPVSRLRNEPPAAVRVVNAYRQFMRSECMLDYNMVLTEGIKLLTDRRPANLWPIWFWDEFQDSGPVDLEILEAAQPREVFITADEDQSIFSFRGSCPENVATVWNDERYERHVLAENYRCAERICEVANAVISQNLYRVRRWTVSKTELAGTVDYSVSVCERGEQDRILAKVAEWVESGIDPKRIAVIARTNALVRTTQATLVAAGLPVTDTATERKPRDWRLLQLILTQISAPRSWSVGMMLIRERGRVQGTDAEAESAAFVEFRNRLAGSAVDFWSLPPPAMILSNNADFSRFGIGKASHELLAQRIRLYEPQTLDELIDVMRESPEAQHSTGVNVLTVHGAKGGEWKAVALVGVDLFDPKDAELNRLFYVGVTRAEVHLYMTASLQRTIQVRPGVTHIERRASPTGPWVSLLHHYAA